MLLQREDIRKPVRRQPRPIKEDVEVDRLYLKKKPALQKIREEADDDVIIDFDDDIDGIDIEGGGYQPKKDNYNIPSHGSNLRHSTVDNDDIQSILVEINDRLANIEDMLRKGNTNNSQKVTVTTQQTTEPVNESLASGDIMGRLRPPQNVVPEGSMLGEIQSVLAQQASMTGDSNVGATEVSGVCTLPNSAYDDDIPDIVE